ncbi:oxygen-independent coproporphyrinogen III oxidase [Marinobacter sp. JSM 1782161]|uniref:oxygen-independent coproporphyrinogen III oxidase n=1 Tax=Marinobacter sp. JSM 1782161 TaxID=2685906 RepID=UPI001402C4D5|nr:oxygen-independent coproporphyrinogen III oxidase [Marinobacter sp. JSM 1782161]
MSTHPALKLVSSTPGTARPAWDDQLIQRYDLSGPRYTSYPTAVEFSDAFTAADMADAARASADNGGPLSLYVHVPFCARLCYYCACNKVLTRRREAAEPYVTRLLKEARMQADLFGAGRRVQQLHWGGGTPTFLPPDQMGRLMAGLRDIFDLELGDERDFSIEIDPRELTDTSLAQLHALGFNRISLGVQDFNARVQKAVNRLQPRRMVEDILCESRSQGFRSINFDLIYGLPHQTPDTFARTVDEVLAMRPDRLSIFSYAHLPQRFFSQTRIRSEDLPSPADKLAILHQTIDTLIGAGYQYIGMDHFALPDDPLAVAQREGRLHRNFQGYTTHGDCDLVALGVSAIGQTTDAYFQNAHDLDAWEQRIDAGELATIRGVALTHDDRIRRWVIGQLICQFRLDYAEFEARWQRPFGLYFVEALHRLREMEADGLVTIGGESLEVKAPGRLLIRAICQLFDAYRAEDAGQRFSRII